MLSARSAYFLSCLLFLLHNASASLDELRRLQRKCYPDISPCVMFMNEEKAFGCGQCGDDVRSAPLREFRSLKELLLFFDGETANQRIVMIPEYIFFSSAIVARLASGPPNVAAVIVFDGLGDLPSVPSDPDELPIEPFVIRSDDDTEPNRLYNFYDLSTKEDIEDIEDICTLMSDKKRNPGAFCFKFRGFFPFNIFRVNASTADEIRKLASRFPDQSDRPIPGGRNSTSPVAPRYRIDSVGQMFSCPVEPPPATNASEAADESATETELKITSEQCLREKTCLPIGGHSLWSALGHLDAASPRNILAITAPMDSISFFPDFALGASAEITSLAVMMAVAEAVGIYRRGDGAEDTVLMQPVYFAWNAQSWGYAGSSRFLKDVSDFRCQQEAEVSNFSPGCVNPYMPSLKFLDFREAKFSVLNIGQMISPNQTDVTPSFRYYTHGRNPSNEENIGEVETVLRRAFADHPDFVDDELSPGDEGEFTSYVPLDASQSFRRYMPDVDMTTIANYNSSFTNSVYHTTFDNESRTESPESLRQPMYAAAEAIASAVINLTFGAVVRPQINTTIIDEAVICLTGNWSQCDLGRDYLGKFYETRAGTIVPGNYAGSFFPFTRLLDRNPSAAAKLNLIRSFFAFHNRYEVPEEETECETIEDCDDFIKEINTRVAPQTHSQLRAAFCTRGVCVASDTYTHNAFGTALNATNQAQSGFQYDITKLKTEFDGSDPQEAGWTESAWGPEFGLCGFVEDTPIYGGLILLAGLLVLSASVLLSLWLDRLMFAKPSELPVEVEASGPQAAPV